MPALFAHGIGAGLPTGFEGRIFKRQGSGIEVANAVAQFATFALPEEVGDFGGGAVNLMGNDDIFTVLFEYGPDSLGTRLFAHQGLPRTLATSDFQPHVLRRGLTGQSGTQWFFTEAGRPFTFYAVLGSHARRSILVPRVNRLLEGLAVEPTAAPAASGAPWN
ncbi:MAG TPA: hypothetical protein VII96_09280 [Acidimicrobiales bacterium]